MDGPRGPAGTGWRLPAGALVTVPAAVMPVAARAQDQADTVLPAGGTMVLLAILALATVAFAGLYFRERRRTAEAGRRLAEERLEAEDRLASEVRAAEARLNVLLEAISVAIWRRDGDGEIAFANRAAVALVADLDKARALAERARQTRRQQAESRNLVVDGDRRLFEVVETPTGDGGTVGTALDVTGLERLQSDLARHVDAHGEVLEKLHSAIAIFGPDRRLSFANAAFAGLWGLDLEMLEREPTLSEVLEQARENRRLPEQSDFRAWREDFNRLFTTLIESHEELLFLPDDSTVRMVVTPHPFGGLLMIFEDVTDRLTLERSYNTLTAVQQETLDNLYEGIAVFGGDGRLKLSNPTFRQQWNIPEDQLADEPRVDTVLEAMRPLFPTDSPWETTRAAWIAWIAERDTRSGRLEQSDARVLDYGLVPLPDGATLINFRDVTDTLAVQRALQERTEALEMADRLKSEFLANVSYELRTPLNAIIGFSEILEQEYAGPMNDRQKEYAHAILQSSNRLVRLVNDILDLASIEAGYLELDRTLIDPAQMGEAVETLGRERARARGINFSVRTADDIGRIEVDERRLTQALYNLVSNAFSFTPDGGQVSVAITAEGDNVLFQVNDTGVGIAPEDQTRVFERFERGGRDAGAGLGLALVKSLVELHEGSVTLSSEPGRGTRVVCRIPRQSRGSRKPT